MRLQEAHVGKKQCVRWQMVVLFMMKLKGLINLQIMYILHVLVNVTIVEEFCITNIALALLDL